MRRCHLLFFVSVGLARASGAQTELLLVSGEEREITPTFAVTRVSLDDPGLCDASVRDGKTVVLVARKAGSTSLKLFDSTGEVGAEYRLQVFSRQSELLRHDVAALVSGAPGIEVVVIEDKVVLTGAARSAEELARVKDVARQFPEVVDRVVAAAGSADAHVVRLGELSPALPTHPGWSVTNAAAGFKAEHRSGGAVVSGSLARVGHGMLFKDAEPELLADRLSLVVEKQSFRLKEHEASLVSWVDAEGRLGYRLTATATPYPVNLEYVVLEAAFSPAETENGEAYFSSVLASLGAPRLRSPPGVPFVNRRAGFLVRYPAGWTVGGETAEGAGFYQNPDNRPVVNATVERLPGSYRAGDGIARAGGLLFERARSRGVFRIEAEGTAGSTEHWSRQILFERGRPLRQKQVVLIFEPHAFALVLTAEPELFRTYETAFSALVESFRLLAGKP